MKRSHLSRLNPTKYFLFSLTIFFIFLAPSLRAVTTVHVGAGGGLVFSPNPITINVGDTVEWVWDFGGHSVTSGTPVMPDGMFDTGLQNAGFMFSFQFNTPGSVPYFCTRHGAMMTGTVNVVAPSPSPSPSPINISGTLSYCSNPVPGPVPNVTLNLTGTASASTSSDGSGNYQFLAVPGGGNYTITPSKAGLTPGSPGINTVDVIAIQRHFLTLGTPLTGCRLLAADVNGVNGVNTVDVVAVQRFFLGNTTGIANSGKYQFSPLSRTYTGVLVDQTGQNYDTLIFGDVAAGFVHRPEGEPEDEAAEPDSDQ